MKRFDIDKEEISMTKVSRMNARDFYIPFLNLSQHRATLTSIDKSGIFSLC